MASQPDQLDQLNLLYLRGKNVNLRFLIVVVTEVVVVLKRIEALN